jgi:hypothetical protein
MIILSFPYFDIWLNFLNYGPIKKKFLPGPLSTQAGPDSIIHE